MNPKNRVEFFSSEITNVLSENKGKTEIKIIEYNEESFKEEILTNCPEIKENKTTWIKITNISEDKSLEELFKCLNFNQELFKKVLRLNYIPEVENYKNYLYVMLSSFDIQKDYVRKPIQVSIILGENYVISLHHDNAALFNPIINKLKMDDQNIRQKGADYLAYTLMDTILDNHILILSELEGKISKEAENIMNKPSKETSHLIHSYRGDLDKIRIYLLPLQQMANSMELTESTLIKQTTDTFLENFNSHVDQVLKRIDTLSSRITEMRDIYNSSMSRRLDDIVRVLTVVTVIFAPGTFIVGIYGMNFQFMPELQEPTAYPIVLLINLAIGVSMLIFFKIRNWI
ncbi:CorA family divalent cation transporter [Methanobacterium sp. ACI-7]|uniref:CorA family divalent cation transporter n=1 Tax=unclassified Methanobacterium TaxID=2627676 RepID=UPI0039C42D64